MAKAEAEIGSQPRALSRMRQRLDYWRRRHTRGTAFPERQWTVPAF
jgi:hypothetical protein